jgi:hypothetical protein
LVLKLVVEPVEGLVSKYFCIVNRFLPSQMGTNGWRAELTLTARLRFSTHSRGETFDRAIPLHIRFPRETFPARAMEAQIEELDVAERV